MVENIRDFEMDIGEALTEAKKELKGTDMNVLSVDWGKVAETAAAVDHNDTEV